MDMKLLGNIFIFSLQGKYLEPIWGTREFMKFIVLITFASTITIYILDIFLYMFTRSDYFLYHFYWCGFSGITSALLVALKQLNPELDYPIFFGYLSIRVKVRLNNLIFLYFNY